MESFPIDILYNQQQLVRLLLLCKNTERGTFCERRWQRVTRKTAVHDATGTSPERISGEMKTRANILWSEKKLF